MSTETIRVVYENLGAFSGSSYYHETLLYTNASGQTFLASCYATGGAPSDTASLISTLANAASGSSTSFGSLGCWSGSTSDPTVASKWGNPFSAGNILDPSNASSLIASGANLSAAWNQIAATETEINSKGFNYSPLTLNSNSAANTALTAAGLAPPTDIFEGSAHWAPAGGNILSTSKTSASTNEIVTPNYDAMGNWQMTVNEKDTAGRVVAAVTLNPTAKSEDVKEYSAGTLQFDAMETVAANNQLNVTITGSNYTGTLSNDNVTFTRNGANDWIVGNNNSVTLKSNAAVYFNDGSTNTITTDGTTGIAYTSYGTLNLASGATNVEIRGNNETINGGTGNHVTISGLNEIYSGSGGEIGLNSGTSVSVVGSDQIDLNSNVVVTASSCTLKIGYSDIIGDAILGSHDSFIGDVGGFEATIGGTYDTGLTAADNLTWEGSTTGDSVNGGVDISNPDSSPIYIPPDVSDPVSYDDPIILALNGGKVQTQNLTTSSAYFDMQNNGVKDHTGWGTAGEGYLMYDPANKNTVTNELSLLPSFAALKKLDTNHDNVINSLDTTWKSLKVWVDNNANGTFTTGSIKTLDQLGIASINLNSTHSKVNQNNNTILDDSTFTWASGATGDIAGVELNFHASTVIVSGGGGGGGGGGGCVQIASVLPDGTKAGDVKVGDAMLLADERTLSPGAGVVSYSARKTAEGYRIVTKSGASLVCSDSAPIPTPEGLVLAPALKGKRVAIRRDEAGSSLVQWDDVVSVTHVGIIDIQHITVGNKCFWAGERPNVFILHHNLKQV